MIATGLLALRMPLPLTARWHLRWTAFRRRLGRKPRKTAWLQQGEEVRRRPPPFRSGPVKHPQHPSTSSLRKPRHRLSPLTPHRCECKCSKIPTGHHQRRRLAYLPTNTALCTDTVFPRQRRENDTIYLHSQPRAPRVCCRSQLLQLEGLPHCLGPPTPLPNCVIIRARLQPSLYLQLHFASPQLHCRRRRTRFGCSSRHSGTSQSERQAPVAAAFNTV
ncbi:hypothetical protein B0H14DRAFT_958826 [Mycena olivaceomarginata]|nr:hypothetical protein B0H14DRAFT_958826 [Mycena olivaceomarginata]